MLLIYGICIGLGVLSLVLSGGSQIYAFMGVFLATGVVLVILAWSGLADSALDADAYADGEAESRPRG